MITSIISVVTCYQPYKNFKVKQSRHAIQFKVYQARVYISIETSNKRTLGARALAVRDSNVSKWCLRARRGIGNTRKKIYMSRTQSTRVSHLVFFWNLILTRPQTTSQVQVNLIHSFFNILSTHAMDERKHES